MRFQQPIFLQRNGRYFFVIVYLETTEGGIDLMSRATGSNGNDVELSQSERALILAQLKV